MFHLTNNHVFQTKRLLCKVGHYAPLTVLKSVYFSIAYPHLRYALTLWGNTSEKHLKNIEVQQNFLNKIITHARFLRSKVASIYRYLDILTQNNKFMLEVLKFVFNFRKKIIPKCFRKYFQPVAQIHNYPTKFAVNNLALVKLNIISTQRSIRYTKTKF